MKNGRIVLALGLVPGIPGLNEWSKTPEARLALQAASKLADHAQATGRYGTLEEARKVVTAEEFEAYSALIRLLAQ